jgi:hypothetical protein
MPKQFHTRRALLLGGLIALAACEDSPTQSEVDEILGCERVARIGVPANTNGVLSGSDCTLNDGSYVDFYSFRVTGSRQVTITLRSEQFDSYLSLLTSSGSLLDTDDDGGGDLDARITTTLSDGTYVIAANSLSDGETGSYSLRVE